MDAIRKGNLEEAQLDPKQRRLLQFVELVTKHAYRTTEDEIEGLREVGWSDAQIAEAVFVTAMFALFNRVADAFGLTDPGYLEAMRDGKSVHRPADRFE